MPKHLTTYLREVSAAKQENRDATRDDIKSFDAHELYGTDCKAEAGSFFDLAVNKESRVQYRGSYIW